MRYATLCLFAALAFAGCDMVKVYQSQIDGASRAIDAAKNDAERATAYAERGRAYSNKGRLSVVRKQIVRDEYLRLFTLALADHDRAVLLAPGDATTYLQRGLTYYDRAVWVQGVDTDRAPWFDAARADFATAVGKDPSLASAHDYLGMVNEQTERFDEAIANYTRVLALDPRLGRSRLTELYCNLGNAHLGANNYDLAASDFEKSIEFNGPTDGCSCEPYNPLAYIYVDATGQYDKGWELVRRAQGSGHAIAPEYVERLERGFRTPRVGTPDDLCHRRAMTCCPACSHDVPEGSRFCPRCGAPFTPSSATATRTSIPSEIPQHGASPARHLTTDPSRGGRFLPGTVLAGRYRILGLLGRGGMGEVYRADDLKLGQAVALKFLPASVEKDAGRLQRFLNEVKLARQISHPNICRVYDVGEVDGHHYLSMEYVDGEDLASLLRRIGRLPQDKALQISRELCQGLAAAHEQGILHRDLKPANVMIDGRGRAKIADFGLATIADEIGGAELGAGTPAYMSPEQRAGRDVTVRSDLYALGLVLYELTTGKPAFTVQGESTPTSPSRLVDGLDPTVERVILRCVQSDPVLRPASALAVAAALPGGDPLAEAVAAGETPSPQMVANAAAPGSLSPLAAWACLIASLALAFVSILALDRMQLLHLLPLGKNPEALADRARETIERLGYKPLPYENHGFVQNGAYLEHIGKTDASKERWERLRNGQPSALRFWLRQSPVALTPGNPANILTNYADPAFTDPGTVGVWLDTRGRLVQLDAVPPRYEPATRQPVERAATNWSVLFEAAGMKIENFRSVAAEWSPVAFADERQAWEGVYPDAKDIPIRIEAAAFAGRPVSFRIIDPWATPKSDAEGSEGSTTSVTSVIDLVLPIVILIGGALLAVRNIKLGRSDRRGAFRIGMYLFVVRMLVWIFKQNDLTGELTSDVFLANFSYSLYRFVLVWICYVAIEPYLRRFWPRTMISWTRVLEGRWRDPLVGRDVLLGALMAGVVWLWLFAWPLASLGLGTPLRVDEIRPDAMVLKSLGGLRPTLSAMLFMHAQFVLNFGFSMIVLLVLLRLLTRRTWIAVTIWIPMATLVAGPPDAALVMFLVLSVLTLAILFRLGVLCLMVVLGLSGLQVPVPATLSTSAWYAGPSWLFLGVFAAVAVYGFVVSLGGRRAFSGILAED